MWLGVATPGVELATVHRLVSPPESVTVVRTTRCGRVRVPLAEVSAVTIYLRECAVSVHAAERLLASLPRHIGRRILVVGAATATSVPRWLSKRFDCPVLQYHSALTQQRCHR